MAEPISNLYLKAAAQAELEIRRIRNSCAHFIAAYVWIEDKTTPNKVSRFDLWPGQLQVLLVLMACRLVIIAKARQLGLTWLALAYAVWHMINEPGFTVIAISKTEPDAIELVDFRLAEVMLPRLPPWLIRQKRTVPAGYPGLTWEASKHELTIYHPADPETGEERLPSRFKALAASEDAGRSVTADLLLLDEWAKQQWAREIWTAAYPTVSAAGTKQQVIGLSTGEKGTLFEDISLAPEQYGFKLVFLPWQTDPRRDEAWYQQQKRALPNSYRSEFPATLADAFAVGQGAFFSEWSDEHAGYPRWTPPKAWKRIGGYDPGFSGWACFKWYAMHPKEGWLRCYREYYVRKTTDVEQARAIVDMSKYPDDSREVIEYVAADSDAWTANRGTGESTADVFRQHGLNMRQADKTLPVGWMRLHEWLRPLGGEPGTPHAWLTFTPDCAHTIRTYPGCKEARNNPEDIDKATEHHAQDVDRYVVMSRPRPSEATGFLPGGLPGTHRRRPGGDDDDDDNDRPRRPSFYGR